MGVAARPIKDRFLEKIRKTEGCWEWTGVKLPKGYGHMGIPGGKSLYAHRLSYMLHIGEIPDGLFVLHKCDNPSCVRPSHLFLGTAADNSRDMVRKGRSRSGEKHPRSTLREIDVVEMRRLYGGGKRICDLAKMFGIGRPAVHQIVNFDRWKGIGNGR